MFISKTENISPREGKSQLRASSL